MGVKKVFACKKIEKTGKKTFHVHYLSNGKKKHCQNMAFCRVCMAHLFWLTSEIGGGDKKGAIFLVYVVAHLVFFEVAQLTGENV